jgi:hypothetical protein
MKSFVRLFVALIAPFLLLTPVVLAVTSASASAAGDPMGGQFISLLNTHRSDVGLSPLVEDSSLDAIAQNWSNQLLANGTLSHNPNMSSLLPADWAQWGENVGMGPTVASLDTAFMNSPEHRANVLGPFTEVGVGVATESDGTIFVTVDFLRESDTITAAACSDSDPIDVPSANAARGYYVLGNDGGIFSYGNAPFYGSVPGDGLHIHAVLMSLTPDQAGYWILGADGGVFSFGDAGYYGSAAGTGLTAIDLKPTADGHGYWVLGSNGTVDGFGDAPAYGSLTGAHAPAVKLVPTPDGHGYWILTTDGNVYSFGDAATHGNLPALGIHDTAVSMAATTDGNGYWILGADGGIFSFGDAAYHGSIPGLGCQTATGVQLIATHTGNGYYILSTDGRVFPFGDAPSYGQPFNLGVTTTDLAVRG